MYKRQREAFELVGALWLHDATATHVERPTVASAWARELRRAARDDAVGSWLAARARAEVRNTGDGVRAAFLHLARHDVAAAAKACAAAGRTRAALCLAARDEPDSDPAMQVEFARARANSTCIAGSESGSSRAARQSAARVRPAAAHALAAAATSCRARCRNAARTPSPVFRTSARARAASHDPTASSLAALLNSRAQADATVGRSTCVAVASCNHSAPTSSKASRCLLYTSPSPRD